MRAGDPAGTRYVVTDRARHIRTVRAVLLFVFFCSGFAALLYQTVWQRMLTLFGGADVYSVTIIVAAFMAGLGFGHMAGGHLSDRLTTRWRIVSFAACELAVGAFALFSTAIYYDYLYVRFGGSNLPLFVMALVIFCVTLLPTFLMGMSLPLAARLLGDQSESPERWLRLLYGWNTLGGACGSFVAVTVLFRTTSLPVALRVGAALSMTCGFVALIVAPILKRSAASAASAAVHAPGNSEPATPPIWFALPTWIAIYALSGFIALSLEIVWFRVLGVVLKSNSFTFGYLLTIYLGGVALGALAGNARVLQRFAPVSSFFATQALIPVYSAVALAVVTASVGRVAWAQPLWDYMGSYETLTPSQVRQAIAGGDTARLIAVLGSYVGVPALLIAPPTVMMGISFGLLQRAVQTDVRLLGRRVGWLQTANVIGAMLGATMTGLVLLAAIGSVGTVRLLCGISLLFAWLYVRSSAGSLVRRGALLASCLVGALLPPSSNTVWARLHNSPPEAVVQREDGSGLSLLKFDGVNRVVVFVNGLGQSQLPYGGIHTALGALPVLLHPNPRSVAVIGLGSGDTMFATGGRAETEVVENIEIVGAQIDTLRTLVRRWSYPGLQRLLTDPRMRFRVADGRAFIRKNERRYDIIEADALRPASAFAGNLYSVEYFQLLRDHLEPGGYAVSWAPTERVSNGMAQVFPYVIVVGGVAIGSVTPIGSSVAAARDRLATPFTTAYYAEGAVPIAETLAPYFREVPITFGPGTDRSSMSDVNHDLFPKDEFAVP